MLIVVLFLVGRDTVRTRNHRPHARAHTTLQVQCLLQPLSQISLTKTTSIACVSFHPTQVSPFCVFDIRSSTQIQQAICRTLRGYLLRIIHRILLRWLATRRRRSEFAADLRRYLRVRVRAHDIAQRIFLLRREVLRIALAEYEQALVPQDGERALLVCVCESDEVEHERVEDLVRQRVLLVQQHADEQRCRPCSCCACIQRRSARRRCECGTHRNSPSPQGG